MIRYGDVPNSINSTVILQYPFVSEAQRHDMFCIADVPSDIPESRGNEEVAKFTKFSPILE